MVFSKIVFKVLFLSIISLLTVTKSWSVNVDSLEHPEFYLLNKKIESEIASSHYDRAALLIDSLSGLTQGDSVLTGITHYLKGVRYSKITEHEKALSNLFHALRIFKEANDKQAIGDVYFNLAFTYTVRGKSNEAINFYEKAIAVFTEVENTEYILKSKGNMAILLARKGDYERSLKTFRQLNSWAIKVNNKPSQLAAFQNMGRLFLITDRIDSSKTYLNKAVNLAEEINSPLVRADAMGNLAELNYSENKIDEAIEKWSASIETYLDAGEASRSFHSFRNIIEAYEKVGNYKVANEYLKKYHALADSIYTVEKEKAIASLENEIEVTEKENEIELLQAQKKSEQRKTYFFISLFVLAATGGAAITIKLRSDRKLKAKKNEVLQKELEVKTAQEERLRSELQLKSRALTKEGLRIIQKNKQLEDFKDRINDLAKKVPGEARSDLNGIKSALKYAFSVDKDWKEFSVYFEDVHPQFLKKLDELDPPLTPKEKRLCALMKVEMSTKEIASVLNISPDSVKKAKTRLRRKLKVAPREDLIEKIDV